MVESGFEAWIERHVSQGAPRIPIGEPVLAGEREGGIGEIRPQDLFDRPALRFWPPGHDLHTKTRVFRHICGMQSLSLAGDLVAYWQGLKCGLG